MINDGINDVPEKTIAIFQEHSSFESKEIVNDILKKSTKKRDWFLPHFYRCLPLTIGNQYGFTISAQYDIRVIWDGGNLKNSISFIFDEDYEGLRHKYPQILSHFGSGILTINPPFALRTPPGVNLMSINPPNVILENITVMTGVIETDNLRRNFTFNLKIQQPHTHVIIPKGTPLVAFIPIPRYYSDKFELKFADEIFNEYIITEEIQAGIDADLQRNEIEIPFNKNQVGRDYFLGRDIYKTDFKDHQSP
jgi:hypothetical protein